MNSFDRMNEIDNVIFIDGSIMLRNVTCAPSCTQMYAIISVYIHIHIAAWSYITRARYRSKITPTGKLPGSCLLKHSLFYCSTDFNFLNATPAKNWFTNTEIIWKLNYSFRYEWNKVLYPVEQPFRLFFDCNNNLIKLNTVIGVRTRDLPIYTRSPFQLSN